VPEIAAQILLPPRRGRRGAAAALSTAALNALRNQAWAGGYAELRNAVRSLALGCAGGGDRAEEVSRLLAPQPSGGAQALPLDLPLREAREAFERVYFEHHLQLEGGNMTRLAEKTGLERTPIASSSSSGISSGGATKALEACTPAARTMGSQGGGRTVKIIILGAGQVGTSVAESLVSEANDITVVDTDAERLALLQDRLDLRTVTGNALQPSVLRSRPAPRTPTC
jgi:hypothetical protein